MLRVKNIKPGDIIHADNVLEHEQYCHRKCKKEEYIVEKVYSHMVLAYNIKNGHKLYRGFGIGDLILKGGVAND